MATPSSRVLATPSKRCNPARRRHSSGIRPCAVQSAQSGAASKPLPLDPKQAEKYLAISRAFEARLDKLYKRAPDDQEMPDFSKQVQDWDEAELLEEGRKLDSATVGRSSQFEMHAAIVPLRSMTLTEVCGAHPRDTKKVSAEVSVFGAGRRKSQEKQSGEASTHRGSQHRPQKARASSHSQRSTYRIPSKSCYCR